MLSSYRAGFQLARLAYLGPLRAAPASLRQLATGVDEDTHDDFKPKIKEDAVKDVAEQIKNDVSSHKVYVFMKGTPAEPQCGFSNMACRILDAYGVEYGSSNVLADPELREGIKKFTSWPTIPQVFVNGEFVGGSDILYSMHQNGELKALLSPEEQKSS